VLGRRGRVEGVGGGHGVGRAQVGGAVDWTEVVGGESTVRGHPVGGLQQLVFKALHLLFDDLLHVGTHGACLDDWTQQGGLGVLQGVVGGLGPHIRGLRQLHGAVVGGGVRGGLEGGAQGGGGVVVRGVEGGRGVRVVILPEYVRGGGRGGGFEDGGVGGGVLLDLLRLVVSNLRLHLLALLLRHTAELHRFSGHAQTEALLQAAVLAPVAVDAVDGAVPLSGALVVDHPRLRAPEEAFAALAGDDAVVDAAGLVAAHFAGDDLYLGCKPAACGFDLHVRTVPLPHVRGLSVLAGHFSLPLSQLLSKTFLEAFVQLLSQSPPRSLTTFEQNWGFAQGSLLAKGTTQKAMMHTF